MCGIAGFNWNNRKKIETLCQLFKHRGPDQEGYYTDEAVSLGHKRLSIIDLSVRGKQPLSDDEETLFITYNGEIFNLKDIREELKNKYAFKTQTDTEVILRAYQEWGTACVNKFNGQFAFCIYDKKKQHLFLARDRIGILPLYYYDYADKFIFGSELKIILKSGITKEIDDYAFHYYLAYGYTPRSQSIIKYARKLEPGHYLVYDLRRKEVKEHTPYWDVQFSNNITDEDIAKERVLDQLEKSVTDRLIADVPVGAFLSGGIDSSAVVAMISKHKKDLNTFSITFDHAEFDESVYAKKVAETFNTTHHVIAFTAQNVKELIPTLGYHYDEPFGDPSMIPTYLVSKVARKHVTVCLSGDGGDELFGGYGAHKNYKLLQLQNYYPRFLNYAFHFLLKPFPFAFLEKPKAFFEIGTLPKKQRYARLMSYLSIGEFKKLTGQHPRIIYHAYERYHLGNYLNTATNSDLHLYLPDDILTKVDRASLANSLESRPPLLDHDMIELAANIHPSLKLRKGQGKYILKKALEGILPHDIIYRKKMGFGVPLKHYFKNELKDLVYQYVFHYDKHNLFNKEYLSDLEKQYNKQTWNKDYSRIIWSILMFNIWWNTWM